MNFMKDSLIDKIENMKDLRSHEVEDYPHLMIYFCQKNKSVHRYQDYVEEILMKCPSWIDNFKSNNHLLKFIVNDSKF